MNTDVDGNTAVWRMTNELNKKQKKFTYAHKQMSKSTKDYMVNAIISNVYNDKPTILHAITDSTLVSSLAIKT